MIKMTTILNMPLKSLDEKTIQDLKKKYPEAVIRIEADESASMNEIRFWSVIELLDWKKEEDPAILLPAVQTLSQCTVSEIQAFHEILAQKLFLLDGKQYAEQTGANKYADNALSAFSADGFLYARCVVVANGRDFFNRVLSNPADMPKDFSFEALLYLPEEAYKLKTGKDDYDYLPETWYETFSNPEGWPDKISLKEKISGNS